MSLRSGATLVFVALFAVSASGQVTSGSDETDCPGGPETYVGRTVADVEVTSPFDFIQAVKALEKRAKESLTLKQRDNFTTREYTKGMEDVEAYIRTRFPPDLVAFRLVAVTGSLEPPKGGDCSSSVIVHYRAFTAVIPRTPASLPEIALGLIEKPSGNSGALSSSGILGILPNLNYNHTRSVFGGLSIDQDLSKIFPGSGSRISPLKVFDHFVATPAVSANSTTGTLELIGSANPAKKYLNRANWLLGTQYYDVPVDASSITKGLLSAQGFVSTKELASAITLRLGGEIGGGHVQDGTGDTANSSYGEGKLLAGLTVQHDTFTGTASYGFEAGVPFSSSAGTFEKHIFDGRFAWTYSPLPKHADERLGFIGKTHRPLTIEAQANGGLLTGSSAVPSVERFFGGNQARPFIPGQPWDASSQPFIRSIAENELGVATGAPVIGGDRFYSTNLTVAKALWGKALVPSDLADQDFLNHLDSAIKTAKGELSDAYYARDPNVKSMVDAVDTILDDLNRLKTAVDTLPATLTNSPGVKPIQAAVHAAVIGAVSSVKAIQKGQAVVISLLLNTKLPQLDGDLGRLSNAAKAAGDTDATKTIDTERSNLQRATSELQERWKTLDSKRKAARDAANAHAKADFAPAERVLNTLLYTLNAYSIAPVAIFDVARVWPEQHGTRYGPGAGVRLSVVNANFTVGYAYNPTQANHEGAGAVFFKLDFTDLFR